MKEGYKPFIMVNGSMSLSASKYGVTFSSAVVKKLEYPAYINLYINRDEKLLAIESASKKGLFGIDFFKPNDRLISSVRINSDDLKETLASLMDWNLENHRYVVEGVIDYQNRMIEFDLNQFERKEYGKGRL